MMTLLTQKCEGFTIMTLLANLSPNLDFWRSHSLHLALVTLLYTYF
jgi:hypothetical protein